MLNAAELQKAMAYYIDASILSLDLVEQCADLALRLNVHGKPLLDSWQASTDDVLPISDLPINLYCHGLSLSKGSSILLCFLRRRN